MPFLVSSLGGSYGLLGRSFRSASAMPALFAEVKLAAYFVLAIPDLLSDSANAATRWSFIASSCFPWAYRLYMCVMVFGKTLAKAAMHPALPTVSPAIRKSDCPPNTANSVLSKTAANLVILPTEAHVSLTPTMFLCPFANCSIVSDSMSIPLQTPSRRRVS